MANLLVVEDDEFLLEAMKIMLEGAGHTVTTADNGKMAIHRMENESFDCIISDVQMPALSGIELAKWARENRANIPFIMMTGYSDSIGTMDAIGKGAANLLYKPFSDEEMIRAVNHSLRKKPLPVDKPKLFDGFAKVPTRSVLHSHHAEFNLYRDDRGQLLKVVSRGEPFKAQNELLKDNDYLYTELINLAKLIPINIMVVKAAVKNPALDSAKKAEIIQQSLELIYEKIGATGLDEQAFDDSSEFIKCFLQSAEDNAFWSIIGNAKKSSNPIYMSAIASTAVAVLIAQNRKMPMEECFKAAAAGLFHDIGKLQLDPRIVSVAPQLLSETDRIRLEQHVALGVQALKKITDAPEICQIIAQHHENCVGTGYPNKLVAHQIHPIARILLVADEFCERVLKAANPSAAADGAIAAMESAKEFDPEFVMTLRQLFNTAGERLHA